jgi:hypothetical protein
VIQTEQFNQILEAIDKLSVEEQKGLSVMFLVFFLTLNG